MYVLQQRLLFIVRATAFPSTSRHLLYIYRGLRSRDKHLECECRYENRLQKNVYGLNELGFVFEEEIWVFKFNLKFYIPCYFFSPSNFM